MAISQRLTDYWHFLQEANYDPSFISNPKFLDYLKDLDTLSFCEYVLMVGFELRDVEFGSLDGPLEEVIDLFEKHKIERESEFTEDIYTVMYNLGLANLHMYFCKRSGFNITSVDLDHDDALTIPIKDSIEHLKQSLILLSEALDLSKGLFHYQVIQCLDYAWAILDNYKVNNDNKPIDLDSSYIWLDQLPDGYLWEELSDQMRKKYNLR